MKNHKNEVPMKKAVFLALKSLQDYNEDF